MKKQLILLVVMAVAITQFWGCDESSVFSSIKGSGNVVDVQYSFEDFNRVEVSNAFQLSIVKSDTFSVVVYVDDNIVNYLEVHRSGNWLIIDLESGHNYNNLNLSAEVHMPSIENLKGSGAIAISMNGFSSPTNLDDFDIELSGASVFSGNFDVDNCDIILSGASVININGICSNLYLEASGASELNMGNFVSGSAYFILSGATDGTITVTDHLDVTLSGASVLRYHGNPEIGNVNITGASSLIKL